MAAIVAFSGLLKQAKECRSLYEAAGIDLPERLQRFLSEGVPAASRTKESPGVIVKPMPSPSRPSGVPPEAIWLPVRQLTATTMVRAMLREHGTSSARAIIDLCAASEYELGPGTLANIGTRLSDAGEINRDGGKWTLRPDIAVPVVLDRIGWAKPDVFDKNERANFRRLCIAHILKLFPDGLQILQLTRQLEKADWVHAPVSKDLIKTDMQTLMGEGLAKRVGNSGKWKAT